MSKIRTNNLGESTATPWYNNQALHIVLLFFVTSAVLFPYINRKPIHDWDEARHAVNALEMLRSGDWVTVTYGNAPDLANIKFPMGAWLIAINYRLFGVNEFSLRLWSVIFTILTTILVYFLGSLIKNRQAGIIAALIFITSIEVVVTHAGTTGDYDAGASFFVALSLLLFLHFYKKKQGSFLYVSMIAVGLGIQYKSFAPGLMPVLIILFFLSASRENTLSFNPKTVFFCALIILGIITPWLIARSSVDGSFIFTLLHADYWQRLTLPVDGHGAPVWYYLTQMRQGFYPWLYYLPLGLIAVFKGYKKSKNEDYLLILVWFFTFVLLFSCASTKNYWYMLPVFPAMAVIIALFWTSLLEAVSRLKFGGVLSPVFIMFLGLNIVAALFNIRYYSYIHQDRDYLSLFIDREDVQKELLSSNMVVVSSNLNRPSNIFYLKRLLNDTYIFDSKASCGLESGQRLLAYADTAFLRNYLVTCSERKVLSRYGNYVLMK